MSDGGRPGAAAGRRPVGSRARGTEPSSSDTASRSGRKGSLRPLLTTLLAFFVGGLVVLVTTGKNPVTTYRAIFEGPASWFFPWVDGVERDRRGQPPADADRHDDADPHGPRGGVRLPVRHVQHRRPGAVPRPGRSSPSGSARRSRGSIPFLHIMLAIVVATLAGAAGRHRRVPEGDRRRPRGDLDDHAQLDRDLDRLVPVRGRRSAAERHAGVGPDLQRHRRGRKLPIFWGDPLLQGLHIGFFVAIAALVVYWVILNRTTLGYGVKRSRLQPRGGPLRGHQRRAQLLPRDGDLGGVRGAGRRDRHPRLAVPPLDGDYPGSQIGFIGIAVALLGRNTAVGVSSRRSCSAPSSRARRHETSTPRSSSPSSRRT